MNRSSIKVFHFADKIPLNSLNSQDPEKTYKGIHSDQTTSLDNIEDHEDHEDRCCRLDDLPAVESPK